LTYSNRQVKSLEVLGLNAIAITAANLKKIPDLWKRIDQGMYNFVYASPEILLSARDHFLTTTCRYNTPFMRNLVCLAFDECHCAQDWCGFRPEYRFLANIKEALAHVACVCLSATVTSWCASYIHEVVRLQWEALRVTTHIWRRNICTIVAPMSGIGFAELDNMLALGRVRHRSEIPKTLIFLDNIDNAIAIARRLRSKLHRAPGRMNPSRVIRTYYGSLDDYSKPDTLEGIKDGRTRIIICTDAFGLGVNVPDIDRVIQWDVTETLNINALQQRVGRCARDPTRVGIAVIFVKKSFLQSVPPGWDTAFESIPGNGGGADPDSDVDKLQHLKRSGLPVRPDTMDKVAVHHRELHKHAQSLQDVYLDARQQIGPRKSIPLAQKLDPSVLWFLCTTGCRNRLAAYLFGERDVSSVIHASWCCDGHDEAHTCPATETTMHGIPLSISVNSPTPYVYPVEIGPFIQYEGPLPDNRPKALCRERADQLECVLKNWRAVAFGLMKLSPSLTPNLLLSDRAITTIITNVGKIVTRGTLQQELERARIRVKSTLLSDNSVFQSLFRVIDRTMAEGPIPTTDEHLTAPSGNTLFSITNPKVRCATLGFHLHHFRHIRTLFSRSLRLSGRRRYRRLWGDTAYIHMKDRQADGLQLKLG
jgi:hypothetical protein